MERTRNMKIAAYVADCLGAVLSNITIVVNADKNEAFIFRRGEGNSLVVGEEFGFDKENFYERAASVLLNDSSAAVALAKACEREKNSFRNLIRNGKNAEADKTIYIADGIGSVSCLELIKLYDEEYAENIAALVKDANAATGREAVDIVTIGICAEFYPLGYTIRDILSPMPLLELIPGFYAGVSFMISSDEAEQKGDAALTQREKAGKYIAHDIVLVLNQGNDNGCTPYIQVLAMKGEYCADHETAVYGRPVLVLRDDPLIILSDYTEYKITVPEVIFGKGRTCGFIKVALVRDNDGLSLMIKSGKKEECIKIDESIYCEVEKNE